MRNQSNRLGGRGVIFSVLALSGALLFGTEGRSAQAGAKSHAITDTNHLLTGFSAKESCSCRYVVKQTQAYCQAFGMQPGFDTETITFDDATQTVTATFAGESQKASAVAGQGCTLAAF